MIHGGNAEAAASEYLGPAKMVGKAAITPGANVIAAIHAVMLKVGYVQKGGENEFHHYRYVTEADTIKALRTEMLAQGLVCTPSLAGMPQRDEHGNTHLVMNYTFHHAPSGESYTISIPASGNDRNSKGGVGDKGIYKAMTGALKYALRQTFMLETGDDPEEVNEVDRNATEDQVKVNHLLKVADTLVKVAHECASPAELEGVWRANLGSIDLLKREHPELYRRVLDAFSTRKKSLTPNQPDNGGT